MDREKCCKQSRADQWALSSLRQFEPSILDLGVKFSLGSFFSLKLNHQPHQLPRLQDRFPSQPSILSWECYLLNLPSSASVVSHSFISLFNAIRMASSTPSPNDLEHIDRTSAALILRLQNEDVAEHLADTISENNQGVDLDDANLAMTLYREEIQAAGLTVADRALTSRIWDLTLIAHEHENQPAPESSDAQHGGTPTSLLLEDYLSARRFKIHMGEVPTHGNSPANQRTFECVGCMASVSIFEILKVPCNHHYCEACLEDLFRHSTNDERYFPPRCCGQEINLAYARLYLTTELIELFQTKSVEFTTTNRVYCARQTCSAFIASANINGKIATCSQCREITCASCKGTSHEGECPPDEATQQVLNLANREGWQRCYRCHTLVELNIGCHHMTYVSPCSSLGYSFRC